MDRYKTLASILFVCSLWVCSIANAIPVQQIELEFQGDDAYINESTGFNESKQLFAFIGAVSPYHQGVNVYLYSGVDNSFSLISSAISSEASTPTFRNVRLSPSGDYVYFNGRTNGFWQLFAYDIENKSLSSVTNASGEEFNDNILDLIVSNAPYSDAVFFTSEATNISDSATPSNQSLFKYDPSDQTVELIFADFEYTDITIAADESTGVARNANYSGCSSMLVVFSINSETTTDLSFDWQDNGCSYNQHGIISTDGTKAVYTFENSEVFYEYDIATETSLKIAKPRFFESHNLALEFYDASANALFISGEWKNYKSGIWKLDTRQGDVRFVSPTPDILTSLDLEVGKGQFSPSFLSDSLLYFIWRQIGGNKFVYLSEPSTLSVAVPPAPSNVSASVNLVASVKLAWDVVENNDIDAYLIERKSSADLAYEYVGLSTTSEFLDVSDDFDVNEVYSYRVGACNTLVQCNFTEIFGAKLIAPAKVKNAFESMSNDFSHRIHWDAVTEAESYEVKETSNFTTYSRLQSGTSYSLSKGAPAIIQIRACLNSICGEFSDPVEVGFDNLGHINNLRYFQDTDSNSYRLQWDEAENAQYYEVYEHAPTASSYETGDRIFRRKVTGLEFIDSSERVQINKTYSVRACDIYEFCTSFKSIQVKPFLSQSQFESLDAPELRVTTSAQYNELVTNDLSFESYRIYRRTQRFSEAEVIATVATGIGQSLRFEDHSISPQTQYFYFIEACIGQQCVRSSDIEKTSLGHFINSVGSVSTISASNAEYENLVKLSWTTQGLVDEVQIIRDGYVIASVGGDVTEFFDVNVTQGVYHEYSLRVMLRNAFGRVYYGKASRIVLGSTAFNQGDAYVIAPPIVTTTADRHFDKVQIDWEPHALATSYVVEAATSVEGVYSELSTTRANAHVIYNLAPDVSIFLRVKACINHVCGLYSSPVEASTSSALTVPSGTASITSLVSLENASVLINFTETSDADYYNIIRRRSITDYGRKLEAVSSPFIDEGLNPVTTYYYSVEACNAVGCSVASQAKEIMTEFQPEDISHYFIEDVSFENEDNIRVRVLASRYQNYPTSFKLYVSETANGSKEFLSEHTNSSYSFSVQVSKDKLQSGDYLFIESCYTTLPCSMHREFFVIPDEEQIGSIPAPIAPSLRAGVGSVDVINAWMPSASRLQIHASSSVTGEKRLLGTIYGNSYYDSSTFDVQVDSYAPELIYIWQTICYRGTCSDFSPPSDIQVLPRHSDEVSLDNINIWDGLLNLGDDAIYLGSYLSPKQQLYVGSGGEFSLELGFEHSGFSQCLMMSFEITLPDFNFELPLVSLFKGGNSCSYSQMINPQKVYIVVANDFKNATELDASEVLSTTKNLTIRLNANNSFGVDFDGQALPTVSLESLKALDLDFTGVQLKAGSSQAIRVFDFRYQAYSDFERERPEPSSVYSSSWNSYFETTSRNYEVSSGKIRRRYLRRMDNDELEFEAQTSTSNYREVYYPETSSYYLIQTQICAEKCSSASYSQGRANDFISTPTFISAVQVGKTGSVDLTWAPVDNATFYRLWIGSRYGNRVKELVTTNISARINNIATESFEVSLEACNGDVCSRSASMTVKLSLDSDGDGLLDSQERLIGSDPFLADTDADGLSDFDEARVHRTNALSADSDGDGFNDKYEIDNNRDPMANDECVAYLCGNTFRAWKMAELEN